MLRGFHSVEKREIIVFIPHLKNISHMRTLLSVNGGNLFEKIVIIIENFEYFGGPVLYDAKTKRGYYPVKIRQSYATYVADQIKALFNWHFMTSNQQNVLERYPHRKQQS